MQPQSAQDYKNLLTEVIKKQIVILGPDITLSKARNVRGLTVQNDGTVTEVTGSPQEVTQALIDQFVQLSGLIVKKTMEPLLLGTQWSGVDQTTPTQQPAVTPPPTPSAEQNLLNPTNTTNTTSPAGQSPLGGASSPSQATPPQPIPVQPAQVPAPQPAPAQSVIPQQPQPEPLAQPMVTSAPPPQQTQPEQETTDVVPTPAKNPLAA